MKYYYISVNSNFPNGYYGDLFDDADLNYLKFGESNTLNDLLFKIKIKPQNKIWNFIPTNKVDIYLIDLKVQNILTDICSDEIEFITPEIYLENELIDTNLKLLHITNHSKKGNIYFDEKIYISELLKKKFRQEALKGLVYYDFED